MVQNKEWISSRTEKERVVNEYQSTGGDSLLRFRTSSHIQFAHNVGDRNHYNLGLTQNYNCRTKEVHFYVS